MYSIVLMHIDHFELNIYGMRFLQIKALIMHIIFSVYFMLCLMYTIVEQYYTIRPTT